MNRSRTFLLLTVAVLSGCGEPPAPAPQNPSSSTPSMPALTASAEAPPPPGTAVAAAPVPTQATAEVPQFEGANETEKLTAALRDYYTRNGAAAPAVTSLDALVKARLLTSVPAAPPGKKYVIDMKTVEVRLENK